MEGFLKLSTAVNITVLMIDSSDHVTGKTGLSAGLTIYATKAAGTPATITPTVTELDSTNVKGVYKLALTTGHTDTLGELLLHITATGADPTDIKWQVSTYLPGEAATLQADQAVNATKIGGTTQTGRDIGASVLLSAGTGAGQLDFTSGVVKANATQWLGGTIPAVNVTGVPIIDLKYTLGTISPATAGSVRADSVTGAVGSVTGAVGSVTGNVGGNVVGSVASVTGNVGGNVVGSVASVTARVTANTDQLAGQTVTAAAGVTFPSSVASPTNITAGTITTATNLTNAPTSGDFTAAMKTSLNAATPASVVGAVGSVTGNVGGNVTGSVGSVATGGIAAASFAAGAIDAAAIATDALGALELAAGAASEIATAVRTELAPELGRVDVAVSTRLATAGYTAPDNADILLIKAKTDNLPASPAAVSDIPTTAIVADAVWDEAIAGHLGAGSTGAALNGAGAAGNPWISVLEGTLNAGDLLRITAGVAAGKTSITPSGDGNATVVFRDVSDDSDIVTANMTGSERTGVTVAP